MPAFDSPPLAEARHWPADVLTRVPYWLYQDPAILEAEQQRIYEGATWNYACLEADIPHQGDWRTSFVGRMPVIVTRGAGGAIHAFENRCTHRGALIALDDAGHVDNNMLRCIYHAWSYDLEGNLKGIAFEKGVGGKGGISRDFCKEGHGPRKLRTTTLGGLVFVTLSDSTPPIETYLGPEILGRVKRVLKGPIKVMGRFVQPLPNNWKLYFENVKDTYHASLLHTFFTTFRMNRFTQGGGVLVSADGAHHASATLDLPDDAQAGVYRDQGIRSDNQDLRLRDPQMLETVYELGDRIQLQMLTIFPSVILQQVRNCLAVRQLVPTGPETMDLHWTYFGFEDDSPEMTRHRLRQQNLIGPAGYVSMEDGCVGGFVQRGIAAATDKVAVVEMGGSGTSTQETRATEAAVRGFWKTWRRYMDL